ncbi:Arc family DNA-binding protein [Aeromonas hydrophila]|jgi:plasmid stability protein|uniref:Arc family DNA-binding protein n=1 Tax=Aeromonas hydrophila TaxID=644 RepID=UPI0023619E7F|nr:Arc family DNA-binding protein [Aeromonas hydrophila]
MTDKQVRNHDKFMLRLPDGMRDAITERARKNGRSMNSEIVQIIQDAIERTPTENLSIEDIRSVINSFFDEVSSKKDNQ